MYKMLIVVLLALNVSCNTNVKEQTSLSVEQFYKLNKDTKLSSFENWKVYPRSINKYIFDYIFDEQEIRYFVFESEEQGLTCKQIFPVKDTVFTNLKSENISEAKKKVLSLFLLLKSLKVNSITYLPENDLYFLETEMFYMVHSEKGTQRIQDIKRFTNYVKLDEHWFYLEKNK